MLRRAWTKLKSLVKTVLSDAEAPVLTAVLVSSYYLGGGIMLAIATKSVAILLIFAVPALIWWTMAMLHSITMVQANATCG